MFLALWKKCTDLAAHIVNVELHQGNTPCHTTKVQASYSSTIFNGPGTIGLRIFF